METRRDVRWSRIVAGALLAGVLLAAGLLAACGAGNDGQTTTPKTITVSPKSQTGTSVEAKVGDIVRVKLEANPTTGFSWEFTAGDTFKIVRTKYQPDPNSEGLVGAGGTEIVTLRVTKAGSSKLTGTYRQQWNTPAPDTKPDFSMTIVSTE